jgi:nitroreductase
VLLPLLKRIVMGYFIDLAKHRQSTRKYSDRPVQRELIHQCIEAARLAPSASNSQPWKFIVVDNPELKQKVSKRTYSSVLKFNKFVDQAPVIIAITLEKEKTVTRLGRAVKNKEWRLMDVGIAAEHFCLQADELGLGTCMIGWFYEKEVKELLSIPKDTSIALMISVGYPVEGYRIREKTRKKPEDIISYNKY